MEHKEYKQTGISTITLGGLKTIMSVMGCHPDHILSQGEKVGSNTFQLIPLRGMNFDTIQKSGLIDHIVTMEAPRGGTTGRILCGSSSQSLDTSFKTLEAKPSIISIDFIDGQSAIEIADCSVDLINPITKQTTTYNRVIDTNKDMIFDTFHARDFIVGREHTMQGVIPDHKGIDLTYQSIFDKNPMIVGVHIQDRNPESIKHFLNTNHSVLEYEIRLLKQHLGDDYNKIPVIIELDPAPLTPLSLGPSTKHLLSSLLHNTDTIKHFVTKVNEIWYG